MDVIKDNLKIERAYFKGQRSPVFPDKQHPLVLQDLFFTGESPLELTIKFLDDERFQVQEPTHGMPLNGQLGQPWQGPLVSVTLHRGLTESLAGKSFAIGFETSATVAGGLSKQLTVSPSTLDDGTLKLKFVYPDRHFAALLLNSVMTSIHPTYRKSTRTLRKHNLHISKEGVQIPLIVYCDLPRNTRKTYLRSLRRPEFWIQMRSLRICKLRERPFALDSCNWI